VSSLLLGGTLELLGGVNGPYNVLDETGSFGDPQAVTTTVAAQLTMGSAVSGAFTDNRTCSFQVMIAADNALALAQAESALRKLVNQVAPDVLRWAPDGGYPVFYDKFRGHVSTPAFSGGSPLVLIVTVTMDALPFARSTTQRMIAGSVTSVQLGNFAQPTEYLYSTPDQTDTTPYGLDLTLVPCPLGGIVYAEQTTPPPVDGPGLMQLSLGGYTESPHITSTLAKVGPVTGLWNLSDATNLTVAIASLDEPGGMTVVVGLTDSTGASQKFTGNWYQLARAPGVWFYTTLDVSGATIDLTGIVSWTLWMGTRDWNTDQTAYYYLGMLRAYSTLAALAATANGAQYKLSGILGDAQAPASIAFDRGGVTTNLLPTADASFESGVGSWVGTNANLSTTSSVAVDGTNSLQLSSIFGGVMFAASSKYAVAPSTQYTASLSCRAAATPQLANVSLQWYDAANNFIGSTEGSGVTDTTTGWVRPFVTVVSPATAVSAEISLMYADSAVSELHDVDAVMLCVGTSTVFGVGASTPKISGTLAYRGPSWASINTPSLIGVVAGHATTTAPSPFSGTYHVIAVDTAPIAGGASMVVTQYNGTTQVEQVTLTSTVVAGGTRWGDFGDLTLPLIDIPSQAGNTTYDFAVTGTDVILCDTRGFLVWVPTMTPAPYVWIDEATAFGMGGVFAGTMPDRTDAVSLLGGLGVQPSGAMSLDPGDNYLLVYTLDGAPVNVTISYYDRYLGQRTAA